jgi:hypothetical protein
MRVEMIPCGTTKPSFGAAGADSNRPHPEEPS